MNVAGDWLETGSHRNESVGRELPGPAQIRPGLCCIARPLQFFRLLHQIVECVVSGPYAYAPPK